MTSIQNAPIIPEFVYPPVPGETHRYYGDAHNQQVRLPPVHLTPPSKPTRKGPPSAITLPSSSLADLKQQRKIPQGVETDIYDASASGNLFLLRELLASQSVNEPQASTGLTPLHYAAKRGHLDIVKCLIVDACATVDLPDREGETALLKASYYGHMQVVQFLVGQARADVHQKDKDGWTALHNACSRGHSEIVQFLIECGAKVDVRNKMGHTPLVNAASKGYLAIVEYLLYDADANPLIKNNFGEAAYDAAAASCEAYICEVLERSERLWWTGKRKGMPSEEPFDITTFTDNQPYDPLNFHVTVIVIVHENQRSTSSFPLLSLARPQFSAQALSKSDTCSPWSLHPSGKPSSRYDVPQRGWFWLTDWQIDYTDPHVDTNSGWQYARTFEEPDEAWVHMAPSSGFGWVRRRRWIRVMKRRMDLINGSGGENTQQENTEEEEAIQQEQESSGMDYIERAEVVLMNGKKRDTTNSGEEAEDEGFVLAGDEGRKGANLTVAREELKRYEEAIQILLTGIKADRNPHRKHQATTLATAHIKRAEQISAAVNGTDKPPQQPRNEELEEVGLFNNSPDIVYHAEGELTSNPWSQHLAGTPPLNTGGRLPPSRLSRAQSVAATITSVNTGRSSRNVDLVGGSDDEDEVGGSESVGRLARHNRDETESVTSSAFETIPQTPSTTNASGMAAQHARGGPRRSNTSMMLGQSTMMGQTYQWESDVDAHDCRRCGRRFTFLVRRHHCRRCGLVVCDRCSTCRTTLPPSQILQDPSLNPAVAPPISPSQPQRVCDICFADIGMPTTPSASSFSHPHRTSSLNSSFEAGGSTNVTHGLRRTDSNQSMKDCPACGKTLMDMAGGKAAQEQHVKECLEKGRGGSVSGVRYVGDVQTRPQLATGGAGVPYLF